LRSMIVWDCEDFFRRVAQTVGLGRAEENSKRGEKCIYNGVDMSHSVKITTPIPSPEEIASDLGVTQGRLDGLLALVDRRTKAAGHDGFRSADKSQMKKTAKKPSAKRATGKRVRTAR
jgi:hypothetical protein